MKTMNAYGVIFKVNKCPISIWGNTCRFALLLFLVRCIQHLHPLLGVNSGLLVLREQQVVGMEFDRLELPCLFGKNNLSETIKMETNKALLLQRCPVTDWSVVVGLGVYEYLVPNAAVMFINKIFSTKVTEKGNNLLLPTLVDEYTL